MRTVLPILILAALLLTGLTWAAVPESEPNDDPTALDYAGDLGTLGSEPVVVDGTLSSYGQEPEPPFSFTGDQDFLRFTVPEPGRWVGVTARGFAGEPTVGILDDGFASRGVAVTVDDLALVPAVELPAGDYFVLLAGATGPDDDPYTLAVHSFRIRKAKAKYHPRKPDRDKVKILADLPHGPPALDVATAGLTISVLGQEFALDGTDFAVKGGGRKLVHKGTPPLKKVKIDTKRGRVVIVLKKADLGPMPAGNAVTVVLESGESVLADRVTAAQNRKGTALEFKRK